MYDFLENNLLIICPNSYKRDILKYLTDNKKILNIKFMTIEEYIKKIKFDYDVKTIHYLVKKGMKVENAITYLENMLYIEDKDYHNEKLDFLVSLKKELDDNNLLIYDKLFKKILDRYKIVIYGYGKLNDWQLSLFKSYQLIDYSKRQDKFYVYAIKRQEDEVEMVFQRIASLISEGVDINKISFMNVDSEYKPLIKRYSIIYQIPVDISCDDTLMGTTIGKDFYNMVILDMDREAIFKELDKYKENSLYASIINILNKYAELDIKDIKKEIKYELLNSKVSNKKYDNVIKIKNVFDYVGNDEYIFLLGFNNPVIPNLSLDIDYITDDIKDLVGLPKVVGLNKLSKENTLNYLSGINNLVISYKEESSFNKYFPSILLDSMNYELLEYQRDYKYSNFANKNLFTIYLDDYVKFGIKNKDLDMLYKNYGENEYLSYDNECKRLNKDKLREFLNNELTLSYSSIDNYYKCGFKYYLNDLLKVDLFDETFDIFIGHLFHYVLESMNDDRFDFDKKYNEYLKNREFTNKEKFFIEKLRSDLLFVIEVIKKHQFITGFNKMLYEKKIDIKLNDSPYVHFKGFVDKIMYKEKNGENLVSIIDYKTGNPDIKIDNLEFGLSMQLPIYLYLVNNSHLLNNMKFTGFYLQHILNVDIKKGKKSLEEQKYDNLKLVGYSSDVIDRLSTFDDTYEKSDMIKGMKVNKDGTLAKSAHPVSDDMINDILKITHEKIINAMNSILDGDFSINPKILKGKNVSCKYCTFKDICYMEEKNKVYLTSEPEKEEDEEENIDFEENV